MLSFNFVGVVLFPEVSRVSPLPFLYQLGILSQDVVFFFRPGNILLALLQTIESVEVA